MQEKENRIRVLIRRIIILKKFLFSGVRLAILKPYWHDREIISVIIFSLFINLTMWAYLFAHRIKSPYPIILHYNLFFGVDFLGNYEKVFLLPFVGTILLFLNAILGQFFYKTEKLASYILTLNILIIQIFLMISSYLIIKVNG